jgi:glycosyltransferase involved in cell wall biosynthesis
LIHTAGVGQSAARNAGAHIASGGYLAFLDQDDICLDGHPASLAKSLDDDPSSSMVYSDVNSMDEDGGLVFLGLNSHLENAHPKRSVAKILIADAMAFPSATMIRRIEFLNLGVLTRRCKVTKITICIFGGSEQAGFCWKNRNYLPGQSLNPLAPHQRPSFSSHAEVLYLGLCHRFGHW